MFDDGYLRNVMSVAPGYTTVGVEYSVAALWRYPVKSMQGEELTAADITAGGLLGDRHFAVIDPATGKFAGAKSPRKRQGLFYFHAAYTEPPRAGSALPAVRVTMPGGTSATTDEADLPKLLSEALGREVALSAARPATAAEECDLPAGTFFDQAVIHLLTTATLDRLRSLYPAGRFEPRRFRPNIIVDAGPGTSGFVENDWVGREIGIGEHVRLRVIKSSRRCGVTTLPQGDLPKDSGILRTAARHNNAQVGIYANVISGGPVRRGEPITVL
jgi:uncharacterized protein